METDFENVLYWWDKLDTNREHQESRITLKGAVAKAKANATQAIPELIRIAVNRKHEVSRKEKHKTDAMFGWYRYNILAKKETSSPFE